MLPPCFKIVCHLRALSDRVLYTPKPLSQDLSLISSTCKDYFSIPCIHPNNLHKVKTCIICMRLGFNLRKHKISPGQSFLTSQLHGNIKVVFTPRVSVLGVNVNANANARVKSP